MKHFSKTFAGSQGFTALIGVLVILSVSVMIALTMSQISNTELLESHNFILSGESTFYADSCMEEALWRLKADNTYTGSNLTNGTLTCTTTITDNGSSNYDVESTAIQDSTYYQTIKTNVDLSTNGSAQNIIINSWSIE